MSKLGLALAGAMVVVLTSPIADARDTRHKFPVSAAMAMAEKSGQLPADIKFYWGTQKYPKPVKSFGAARTNKKTNFFNKSDQEGCEWTFLSAMIALAQRAKDLGANAVVNIQSNYRNQPFSSETEYECGAGAFTGGVAFTAEIVKLP